MKSPKNIFKDVKQLFATFAQRYFQCQEYLLDYMIYLINKKLVCEYSNFVKNLIFWYFY